MEKVYSLGVDVGSTTVKTVILDGDEIVYNKYERHFSKVRETVAEQLRADGRRKTIPHSSTARICKQPLSFLNMCSLKCDHTSTSVTAYHSLV